MKFAASVLLLGSVLVVNAVNFTLVKEYSGQTFFDGWQFYGDRDAGLNPMTGPWNGRTPWDDVTNGDVFYMGRANGTGLYTVDPTTGRAIIKVNNSESVDPQQKRESIRIATNDFFNFSTVWVLDIQHLPWGCSVWPAIFTEGSNWPKNGEIDIIENVNRATTNQMSLHTMEGCSAQSGTDQTGTVVSTDCNSQIQNKGCIIKESKPNSYGQDFNNNGGGVWAAQFDYSGIFIWFWPRTAVPASVTSATNSIDISSWGPPSAAYPTWSGCQIPNFFGEQQLVIDITLCGDFAGQDSVYNSTCGFTTPPLSPSLEPNYALDKRCYWDSVILNGTADLAMAYFEIASIRAFSANNDSATTTAPPSSLVPGATASQTGGQTGSSSSAGPTTTGGGGSSAGMIVPVPARALFASAVLVAFGSWILA